ncbi:MAG: cytochrome-c peroxidase [Flavobacteriales bacterium]|nr:cytochrome-c peroxidase [Flavobacteriales bacterium]
MKNKSIFIYVLPFIILTGCGGESLQEVEVEKITEPSELLQKAKTLFGELPDVALNPENSITDEKVALGKTLYFDKRLSKDNTISCNSCHNLDTYGVDNLSFSPGNDGGLGGRNSPTVLNAALHISQFWDGRAKDVEEQAGGPILNPVEMAMPNEKAVIDRLSKIEEYNNLFAKAFPNEKDPITYINIQKAIGAFERKLIVPSKFDDYLAGNENALNQQEKDGLETFTSVGCTACHSGNLLGGQLFQKFGLMSNYWEHTKSKKIDEGKFEVTKNEADKYVFKTPSLRNVAETAPYFHDGSVADLEEAIAIMGKIQLNKELSEAEVSNIAAFLKALTGSVPSKYQVAPEVLN